MKKKLWILLAVALLLTGCGGVVRLPNVSVGSGASKSDTEEAKAKIEQVLSEKYGCEIEITDIQYKKETYRMPDFAHADSDGWDKPHYEYEGIVPGRYNLDERQRGVYYNGEEVYGTQYRFKGSVYDLENFSDAYGDTLNFDEYITNNAGDSAETVDKSSDRSSATESLEEYSIYVDGVRIDLTKTVKGWDIYESDTLLSAQPDDDTSVTYSDSYIRVGDSESIQIEVESIEKVNETNVSVETYPCNGDIMYVLSWSHKDWQNVCVYRPVQGASTYLMIRIVDYTGKRNVNEMVDKYCGSI